MFGSSSVVETNTDKWPYIIIIIMIVTGTLYDGIIYKRPYSNPVKK